MFISMFSFSEIGKNISRQNENLLSVKKQITGTVRINCYLKTGL